MSNQYEGNAVISYATITPEHTAEAVEEHAFVERRRTGVQQSPAHHLSTLSLDVLYILGILARLS